MGDISSKSKRIARNTILLYFRMLLMMFIGLFTSRVVMNALGVDDFGVYGAVGGLVMFFTVITNSISQSISRYISVQLEQQDQEKLKRVFSTAVLMQLIFCGIILTLSETAGRWWLNSHMVIPEGRLTAANWVLQCSTGILMLNLLSVPFNATIIAHEKMDAFALISIVEAVLKLGVALLLSLSSSDKLITYAVLMLAVAIIIRISYGWYCKAHFEESRGRLAFDRSLLREMTGFAGWNTLGSGTYIVNTQGINLLSNSFFGVGVNAARGVAAQVENIVKQFISNMLTAMNPQIFKSYSSGEKDFCKELLEKGCRFSALIMLLFIIPVWFEADWLLEIWLKTVPEHAGTFVRFTLLFLFADMVFNPMLTAIQADGRIKHYYIIASAISILGFFGSWAAFAAGLGPETSYLICTAAYVAMDVFRLHEAGRLSGLPVWKMAGGLLLKVLPIAVGASVIPAVCRAFIPAGALRAVVCCLSAAAGVAALSYFIALTDGEREFLLGRIFRNRRPASSTRNRT